MDIKEVRNNLIHGLESEYTPTEIELIDIRLDEIAEMEHMSLEDLDYYCTANSSEMFACIFDYKEFNKKNFEVDWVMSKYKEFQICSGDYNDSVGITSFKEALVHYRNAVKPKSLIGITKDDVEVPIYSRTWHIHWL